ncbi:MAG: hypothetical protein HYV09_40580 [Deltaproteobacteria bacterium]|nr:hypothetical protein [Deltaproteobacteria bacterium]
MSETTPTPTPPTQYPTDDDGTETIAAVPWLVPTDSPAATSTTTAVLVQIVQPTGHARRRLRLCLTFESRPPRFVDFRAEHVDGVVAALLLARDRVMAMRATEGDRPGGVVAVLPPPAPPAPATRRFDRREGPWGTWQPTETRGRR